MRRALGLAWAMLCAGGLSQAQEAPRTLQRNNLLMHLGFGPGVAGFRTSDGHVPDEIRWGPSIEISAAYAFSARWSMGLQFARIGELGRESDEAGRLNGLHLVAARRLFNTPHWFGEAWLGLGAVSAALWVNGARLPEETTWGGWTMGLRAGRLWSNVLGTQAALHWWPRGSGPLSQGGTPLRDAQDRPVDLSASSAVLSVGVFTRF